jgi:hypothetical protein
MYLIYGTKHHFCQFFVAIQSSQLYAVRNTITEIYCLIIRDVSGTAPPQNAWEIRSKEFLEVNQP